MADTNDTAERWIPIVGYEGRYEVSNLGRVRTLLYPNRSVRTTPLVMRSERTRTGYLRVQLGGRHASVHRLVATAFVTPAVPGLNVCNHIDGLKSNNIATNLEWTTAQGNSKHAVKTGLYPLGDRHGSRRKPESRPRGDAHGTHTHPESVRRGATHGFALRPETHARGERAGVAKLTEDIVRAIRAESAAGVKPYARIAARYGLNEETVGRVVRRQSWAHVL